MNLFKLFKRKEFRLVALLVSNYQRRYLGGDWHDCQSVFYCYEDEKGKRWFTISHNRPDVDVSCLRKMNDYSIINGWKQHAHNLLNIPSFYEVRDGDPILRTDL